MKHILWMMGGWIVLMILADGLYEGRMRSLEDILHDEINQAEMKTYHDEQYGYDIVYPKFLGWRKMTGAAQSDSPITVSPT